MPCRRESGLQNSLSKMEANFQIVAFLAQLSQIQCFAKINRIDEKVKIRLLRNLVFSFISTGKQKSIHYIRQNNFVLWNFLQIFGCHDHIFLCINSKSWGWFIRLRIYKYACYSWEISPTDVLPNSKQLQPVAAWRRTLFRQPFLAFSSTGQNQTRPATGTGVLQSRADHERSLRALPENVWSDHGSGRSVATCW